MFKRWQVERQFPELGFDVHRPAFRWRSPVATAFCDTTMTNRICESGSATPAMEPGNFDSSISSPATAGATPFPEHLEQAAGHA
jgi:hypothetical protein